MIRKKALFLIIVLVFALSLYGIKAAAQMGPGYGRGPGTMGWGYGIGWLWPIMMVVFWIAIIVGIIFLIRWLVVSTRTATRGAGFDDTPLEIIKRRYARGEINKEEFEEKRRDLAS